MNETIPPAPATRSYAVRWSIGLVVFCGLLLGYYIEQAYFTPRHRQYQLDFGNAQWIEPTDPGPTAYFRTKVFLNAPPEQAWLEVSALDNYKAVVNSHAVGVGDSVKTRVAGIYDIKKRLKAGTNVIGVSVSRTSFPGPAQILVRAYIRQKGGKVSELVSDGTWRVTTEKGIVRGSEDWTSASVPDELWPLAIRSAVNDRAVDLAWVDLNPLVLQTPVTGSWLLSSDGASVATFNSTFIAAHTRQETWLQVAASGELDLLINGHLLTSALDYTSSGTRLPHLASDDKEAPASKNNSRARIGAESSTKPAKETGESFEKATLQAFDISYWVKGGKNSITATVRADHRPAALFVSGFVVNRDGTLRKIESNSSWEVTDGAGVPGPTTQAVEYGEDGAAPWGYLPQEMGKAVDRAGLVTYTADLMVILLTAGAVLAIWLLVSGVISGSRGELLRRTMVRDALFHAPISVGLLLLLLPNYDVRFPDEWSFHTAFILAAVIALLGIRLFHLFPVEELAGRARARVHTTFGDFRSAAPYLLLIVAMSLGFALRAHNITAISFDHDEMGLITKSKGIYTLGIPYTTYAGDVRWITTYEAVPYPLALAGLFGYSELTMRLPSCIMGTLSIGLICLLGRRLFNWRTGLTAAFVYACMPLDIRWAQNAFYPQQCQFMALLTILLFYEAIRVRPFHGKFLIAASLCFCITYLSWEGSAFLLPSLFVGLMIYRWGEWWWLKELNLYRGLFFIGAVVVAQYCSRTLAGAPYLQIGSGLSNLTGPSLFFLTSAYQPMFYINKLWLSENHVFFTLVAVLGLPVAWSSRGYRYLFSMLVSLWFCHTNFIAALAPRYCYYYQPLLVLSGVAAAVLMYDRLLLLAKGESGSAVAWACAHAAGVAAILLLFLQSNEWLFHVYKLSSTGDAPGLMTRMGMYRYGYRDADQYVKAHLQPGDVVFPGIPHVYAYYAGIPGDYFLDTLLASKVPYNQLLDVPGFVDKFGGLPVVRNLTELKEVTHRAHRTWLIFAPYASFEKLSAPNVLEYLDGNARIVFETYRAKVLLIEGDSQVKPGKGDQRTALK
jgi:Dolichyl-phosphate-mannose-protein mannosyltransferase